ncbi:MAG: exodeoxyribonuclease VII large subunit, partial [Ruminococcaceae bacterium]|nr:exodeoxyribonuclease VII large subunit [Oscillospiraceae bacterium]
MSVKILTVSEVNGYTKSLLDEDILLSDIFVSGEISNLKRHTSGHMYFTLKDAKGQLSAAMFKWQCQYLRFAPANGMRVVAHGKVTLYEAGGQYQMVVSALQPDGIGALYAAYEQLKEKLEAEGLFAPERKRALPPMPMRVGVVTSRTGAAVQDIINIITRRWPLCEIILAPVMVQGEAAPGQIADAVRRMNARSACDVMIVGRGGGSIEDLWAFNDEQVARTVADSAIPVISAVGH